jgi:hypothetical protein
LSTDVKSDKRMIEAPVAGGAQSGAEHVARRQALQGELAEVDQAAAALWGITPAELADVQRSLKELSR